MRVLIAHPNRLLREALALRLRRDGHEVSTTDGEAAAWEGVLDDPHDAYVIGASRAGVPGLELRRQVRVRPGAPAAILVLTPSHRKEERGPARGAGADAVMTLPVDPDEVAGWLARMGAAR